MFSPTVVAAADRTRRTPTTGVAGWRITVHTPIGLARIFVEAPCSEQGARRYGHAFENHDLATRVEVEPSGAPPWPGATAAELTLVDLLCRRLGELCAAPTRCLHVRVPVPELDPGRAEMTAVAESLGVRIVDE